MVKPKTVHELEDAVLAEVPAGAIVRWTIAIDYVDIHGAGWNSAYVKGPTLYGCASDLAHEVHNKQVEVLDDERGY